MRRSTLILSAARTPMGKQGGALAGRTAADLGAAAVGAAVARSGLPADAVDEVLLGQAVHAGAGQNPARQAALAAGVPPAATALTLNMVCGSGLEAVARADQAIRAGDAEIAVAGGMESLSPEAARDAVERDALACPFLGGVVGHAAERLAQSLGISRDEQDAYALESHRRAAAAWRAGAFAAELALVAGLTRDEGVRERTSPELLARLRPIYADGGSVTAGNTSPLSDGAAALLLASPAAAERHGARPLARLLATASAGTEPGEMFLAPALAVRKALARAKLDAGAVDLWEVNESFAAQMIACLRELRLHPSNVNVHGGALALGHPLGASGARILVTLTHALAVGHGRVGVAALCLGGGNAVAAVVERWG